MGKVNESLHGLSSVEKKEHVITLFHVGEDLREYCYNLTLVFLRLRIFEKGAK